MICEVVSKRVRWASVCLGKFIKTDSGHARFEAALTGTELAHLGIAIVYSLTLQSLPCRMWHEQAGERVSLWSDLAHPFPTICYAILTAQGGPCP